jgi:hypothetical protein
MSDWNDVKTQADIDYLLDIYGGFHDSCLIELRYVSGADVNEKLSMTLGKSLDSKLFVTFKRQWKPVKIELLFEGMRKMHIAGWRKDYFCDIHDCYLALHNDLIKGVDDNLFVWADNASFNPKGNYERNILAEPSTTYIISEKLKWQLPEN